MKTAFLAILFIVALAVLPIEAKAQQTVAAASLTAAKELSAASGRPIFAIAGRKT